MIRYADDLVILCRPGEGKQFKERLSRWLKARGLTLNENKTRVFNSRENGFEFLGFAFDGSAPAREGITSTPSQASGVSCGYVSASGN